MKLIIILDKASRFSISRVDDS